MGPTLPFVPFFADRGAARPVTNIGHNAPGGLAWALFFPKIAGDFPGTARPTPWKPVSEGPVPKGVRAVVHGPVLCQILIVSLPRSAGR
jgi:hypothetical protein